MVLYKARKKYPVLKWILAGIVFITVLCTTFNGVL